MEDDITLTTTSTLGDITLGDDFVAPDICTIYPVDTTGYTDYNVDWDNIVITDSENRTSLRDSGKIPLDIWAKMYNNNKLEDNLF